MLNRLLILFIHSLRRLWQSVIREIRIIGHFVLQMCADLFQKISNIVRLIWYRENFIFGTFIQQSQASQMGVAKISLPSRHIVMITGKNYISGVADYQDPHARRTFKDLEEALGGDFLIHHTDPLIVRKERADLIKFFKLPRMLSISEKVFQAIFEDWDTLPGSVNDKMTWAGARIISALLYNVDTLPFEIVPLIQKMEHAVFNRASLPPGEFEKLKESFKALSDRLVAEHLATIMDKTLPNHLQRLLETHPGKEVKDLNPFIGLLVTGNLSTLLTGVILKLAENSVWFERLKKEWQASEVGEESRSMEVGRWRNSVRTLPFTQALYWESLRYFAPAGPLVRESAAPGMIENLSIPAHALMIVPLRSILHDPRYWKSPERFDPERKEFEKYILNTYPFIPFSVKPRICPASIGMIEVVFKLMLRSLVNFDITLLGKYEGGELSPFAKEPRLAAYYLACRKQRAFQCKTSVDLKSSVGYTSAIF